MSIPLRRACSDGDCHSDFEMENSGFPFASKAFDGRFVVVLRLLNKADAAAAMDTIFNAMI